MQPLLCDGIKINGNVTFLTAVTIGFNQSVYQVDEEDKNGEVSILEICVQAGDLDRDVNVYVTTSSQTAIGETDSHRVEIFSLFLCSW